MIASAVAIAILSALIASINDPDEEPKMPNIPRSRWSERVFIGTMAVLFGLAIFCGFVGLVVTDAWGHSWYPGECCSGRDCAPLADSTVEEIAAGFLIKTTGEVVPFKESRPSPDGRYHLCRSESTGKRLCFFHPLRGV